MLLTEIISQPHLDPLNQWPRKECEAQNNIGFLIKSGVAELRNAITWYTRAAEQGLAPSTTWVCSIPGHGLSQLHCEKMVHTSTRPGTIALYAGTNFYNGDSAARIPREIHFRDGARAGDAKSQYMYSYMLLAAKEKLKPATRVLAHFSPGRRNRGKYKLALCGIIPEWDEDAEELVEYARLHVDSDEIEISNSLADRCLETKYEKCPVI